MPESIPETMRYVDVPTPGGPEALAVATGPIPKPESGEVLIRVKAAGVNRADLMQRQGHYPPPPGASPILGMEVSGHIAALGPEDYGRWRIGDPVCALLGGGGYAEYCVAPAGQCMSPPQALPLLEAAAIPEAALTVWANLFEPRRLGSGDLFLVQGGSSGIGSMAIQIGRCFGARVAATAGTEEKCRFALELGAEKAVNYRTADWAAELAAWSKPQSKPRPDRQGGIDVGIDVILDMVGGDYFPKHLELLATGGRLVHIAFLGGSKVTVDLRAIMTKRLLITGSTLRSRSVDEKSSLVSAAGQHLWPFFEAGKLRPIVTRVFPLTEAVQAHRWMESGKHMGKIVLRAS